MIVEVLSGEQRFALRQRGAEGGIARCTRRRFDTALAGVHLHVRHRQRDLPVGTAAAAMLNPAVGKGAQAVMHVQRTQQRRTLAAQRRQRMQQYAGIQAAAERHQQPLLRAQLVCHPRR